VLLAIGAVPNGLLSVSCAQLYVMQQQMYAETKQQNKQCYLDESNGTRSQEGICKGDQHCRAVDWSLVED